MSALHLPAPPPRASPLWQVVHAAWDDLLARYERHHRPAMGSLRPESVAAVQAYYRCGDLTTGFTRCHCPDCGHEHLLAFACKARHICPACHQRRTRQTADWIATHVCHPVPHRQFVFAKRNFEVFPATILRFHGGSLEWQAIGKLTGVENALRSIWCRRAAKKGCPCRRLIAI